jgi:hypothetical protein
MKKSALVIGILFFFLNSFSQYRNRDGNRIGISAGVSQATLMGSNFNAKPGIGFAGGLSVRGNYYNNWSMIYGMQFFINNFNLETTTPLLRQQDTQFSLSGVQVRLLLSYNVVKDHVSFDFGPVLQVNGKLTVKDEDRQNTINGTLLKANQISDVGSINGNFYVGFSAGGKVVRFVGFYEYGFTNVLNKLNSESGLNTLNGGNKFKGNIGTVNGQIIFNL